LVSKAANRKLLWIGSMPLPPNVAKAVGASWEVQPAKLDQPLGPQLDLAAVALVGASPAASDARLARMLEELNESSTVGVFILPSGAAIAWRRLSRKGGQFFCVTDGVSPEELSAKLSAAAGLQPAISHLHSELTAARNVPAARLLEQLDEEMRLAARIQRDFLPRRLPELDEVGFGVLFRPAGWLSGDIYDVTRLDETHVGFYVADAVGHGMPAALLTMFIKKALQTKRIVGSTYQIVPPEVSLGELNADICRQNLSSCHFCTAVYCVLNTASLALDFCRAGHPEPLIFHADGSCERLAAPGSLLGIFEEEKFESRRIQLRPGDRLVLYTDGAQDTILSDQVEPDLDATLASLSRLPRDEMLLKLTAAIDAACAKTPQADDITVMVMDVR
jgi:serine phosphatase RsbU (regulator of sigma subunit)